MPFEHGIPKSITFARVFNSLDSKRFKACFEGWISGLSVDLLGKQIAIDGKTARGSKQFCDGSGAAHIVSAFVTKSVGYYACARA